MSEVSQGLLCLHLDRDVLHDFGLQGELRGLLDCFDSAWLRPALAAVLRRPPSAGLPSPTAAVIGGGSGGGGGSGLKRTLKADEARRACLERMITLIVLLDSAALQAMRSLIDFLSCRDLPRRLTRSMRDRALRDPPGVGLSASAWQGRVLHP